jgi:hypothetical protein
MHAIMTTFWVGSTDGYSLVYRNETLESTTRPSQNEAAEKEKGTQQQSWALGPVLHSQIK